MTSYDIVNDISKATHFLVYTDPDSCVKDYLIPGKAYELIKQTDPFTEEEEFFIQSEDGYYSMYYTTHAGDFIIVER